VLALFYHQIGHQFQLVQPQADHVGPVQNQKEAAIVDETQMQIAQRMK
jgi:hypothetical protein